MRQMSFSLTEQQLLDGSKTITCRLGWEFLKHGDRLRAVRKAMGLKKGEHPVILGEIEVVMVSRERLCCIRQSEVWRVAGKETENAPAGPASPPATVSRLPATAPEVPS